MHDLTLFAAAPPGLEFVTQMELRRLGVKGDKVVPGGVEFEGSISTLYLTNLWLRSAQRVLVRVGGFFVVHLAKLRKKLDQIPFEYFLDPLIPIAVKATCRKSRIYHSKAAAERAALAIQTRLGLKQPPAYGDGGPTKESRGVTVVLRIENDHCTVSLDSSGDHLHRRGYRTYAHDAPLRENLAAAMLYQLGYDGTEHFWDPMCGSGTLSIEAALIASNTPPGRHRRFAFMDWPNFNEEIWTSLLEQADAMKKRPSVLIGGSDIDESSVEVSRKHAQYASVDKWVRFRTSPIEKLFMTQPKGLMATNPPYGKRIGSKSELKRIYHILGECVVRHSEKWRLGIVMPDNSAVSASGLDMRPVGEKFPNGGLRVQIYSTLG